MKKKNYRLFLCLAFILIPAVFLSGCKNEIGGEPTDLPEGSLTDLPVTQPDEPPISIDLSMNNQAADETPFSYSEGIAENGFWEGIKALEYVDNLSYKGMEIPADIHQVPEDAIQDEIQNLLSNYPVEVKDRAVKNGDTVNIDYVGSIDGVEFEGGNTGGNGTEVIIGETQYIDDFLEQLIGHTPGETVNVEVTFPDEYHEATLQGKDALFVTVINYILAPPPLTDEFVKENLSMFGWFTVSDTEDAIRQDIKKSSVQQYLQANSTNIANIKTVPIELVNYQERFMLDMYSNYARMYGMELDDFIKNSMGVENAAQLIETYHDKNVESAQYHLVLQAIAEDANLSVSDDDLTAYAAKYFGSEDYSSYVEYYGKPYFKQMVLDSKIIEYVIENANLAE